MDYYLFQKINGLAGKWVWLDAVAVFLADYLEFFLVAVLLASVLLYFKKYRLLAEALAAALFARLIVVEIIRWVLPRSRPFVENSVNLLINHSATSSFPSGHAAFFFAIAEVFYFYNKKTGIILFFAAFLISVARIFVGVHWASDILAGAIVGIISGWFTFVLFEKVFPDIWKQKQ